MSKELHKDVRSMTQTVTNLGLSSTDINGMICSRDSSKRTTVIVSDCGDAWETHKDWVTGDKETPLRNMNGKKAFILPGSSISADRMKQELGEHSIKITNKVADADVFITNSDAYEELDHNDNLPMRKIMFKVNNGYSITEFETCETLCDAMNDWMEQEQVAHVINDPGMWERLNSSLSYSEYDSLPYDCYVYTGMGLEILEKIRNGAETVHEDRVLRESPNMQPLTDELLETIVAMYRSGDDDKELLVKILPTIQSDVNHHLIWKMCQEISHYRISSRNKDFSHWVDDIRFDWYQRLSAEEFIQTHDENETLTPVGFKYMEPLCRQDIYISNRDLYVFKVEIKPEYREKYLKIKN